jgi:hypothetical protein
MASPHGPTLTSSCRCVSYSDPFGLKVCFGSDNRNVLVRGVETAFNVTLGPLDAKGCVQHFTAGTGEGWAQLQSLFGELVQRDATYTFQTGTLKRAGEYNGNTRTATFDLDRLKSARYPVDLKGTCLPDNMPLSNNHFSLGAVIAHEAGHAYNGLTADSAADERGVVPIENEYHSAAGEAGRCAYEVDARH